MSIKTYLERKIYKNGYIYKAPLFHTSGEVDYAGHIYTEIFDINMLS